MEFDLSARSEAWRGRLQAFFEKEVLPRHRAWVEHTARHRETAPFIGELQHKARAAGLWNLGLPELGADEPGTRLSNLDYAPLAEIMGRLFWASEVFNCQAPDVPNMIALQNCATPEQKARWLRPLLEAETRSAFAHDRAGRRFLRRDQYRHHDARAMATTTSSTAENGSSPAPHIRAAAS